MLFFWWDDMNGPDMQQFSAKHQRERERSVYLHIAAGQRKRVCVCFFMSTFLVWPWTHKYYFTFSIFLIRPLICPIYEFTLRLTFVFL